MKYKTSEGIVVDTERAQANWPGATYFDGPTRIDRNTGSQWSRQILYRSQKGRYYVETQSPQSSARFLGREEAAQWLLVNDYPLPEDLEDLKASILE